MNGETILKRFLAVPAGSFVNVEMTADLRKSLKAEHRNNGVSLFRQSQVQAQARVPYSNIAEVKAAMESGERDAPKLPFAASGVQSVTEGVIFYTPKNPEKPLLVGFRPTRTIRSRFIDGNGNPVSDEDAEKLLIPSYFKKAKNKEEHAASGTGNWRTVYTDTVTKVGEKLAEF